MRGGVEGDALAGASTDAGAGEGEVSAVIIGGGAVGVRGGGLDIWCSLAGRLCCKRSDVLAALESLTSIIPASDRLVVPLTDITGRTSVA